jgi:hypothetical protein
VFNFSTAGGKVNGAPACVALAERLPHHFLLEHVEAAVIERHLPLRLSQEVGGEASDLVERVLDAILRHQKRPVEHPLHALACLFVGAGKNAVEDMLNHRSADILEEMKLPSPAESGVVTGE